MMRGCLNGWGLAMSIALALAVQLPTPALAENYSQESVGQDLRIEKVSNTEENDTNESHGGDAPSRGSTPKPVVQSTNCIGFGTWGTCPWEIDRFGVLTVHPGTGIDCSGTFPWRDYAPYITGAKFVVEDGKAVVAPSECDGLLYGLSSLRFADLSGLDTSAVTDMSEMFHECHSLTDLDISGFDTSHVRFMHGMFWSCINLRSLDLSGFDTASVVDLSLMFSGCNELTYLDLSGWDTSSVSRTDSMFNGCWSLERIVVGEKTHLLLGSSDSQKWYSVDDGVCYTQQEIFDDRSGIAATYTTYEPIESAVISISQTAYIYDGKAKEPAVTVSVGGRVLEEGTDYSITYDDNVVAGTAKVLVEGIGNCRGTAIATFSIAKAAQRITASDKHVTTAKTVSLAATTSGDGKLTYESSNPAVAKVSSSGVVTAVTPGSTKITVSAAETNNYKSATRTVTVTVKKGANTLKAKTKKAKLKASFKTLKTKKVTLTSNVKISNAKGAVSYANASSNKTAKKFKVNAKNGKVTIPKGTKKGTYTVKVKVIARGNANWKAGSKTVTFKVVVK